MLPHNLYMGRFSALIPLLYLVVGFPLDDLWRFVRRVRPRVRPAWAGVFLVPLFLLEAALGARTLFVVHLNSPIVRQHYDNYLLAMCTHLRSLGDEPYVYAWAEQQPLAFLYGVNDYSWACQDPEGAPMFGPFSALTRSWTAGGPPRRCRRWPVRSPSAYSGSVSSSSPKGGTTSSAPLESLIYPMWLWMWMGSGLSRSGYIPAIPRLPRAGRVRLLW